MRIRDLANEYQHHLYERALDAERVNVTVRMGSDTKERLDRIADEVGVSAQSLYRDLLRVGSVDLCKELAAKMTSNKQEADELFFRLAWNQDIPDELREEAS